MAGGKRYMIAGNWAQDNTRLVLNPSYFAPYAWRMFAKFDNKHDWASLITPAYELLTNSGKDKLDKDKAVGLAPDWVSVNRTDGTLQATALTNLKTDYSYDAMRTAWRIALDYAWNKEPRAHTYLTTAYTSLVNAYRKDGRLSGSYAHDGVPTQMAESPVMYGTIIGAFREVDPALAGRVYQEKIISLYSNDTNGFKPELPYYEQNWLWFGAALYKNYLQPFQK